MISAGFGRPALTSARSVVLGVVGAFLLAIPVLGAPLAPLSVYDGIRKEIKVVERVEKTKEEWRKVLAPESYEVLREKGTERPFTGKYDKWKADGVYACAGCGNHLYDSADKYDSGTGWPSFTKPIAPGNIGTETDRSFFSTRTEIHCARCGGHLGHVFNDGPPPTGLRYCMNSVALTFLPRK